MSLPPLPAGESVPGGIVDPENPGVGLTAPGRSGKAIVMIALAFSLWQIYAAAYSPVSSIVLRSMHVGFLTLLAFALFRARKADSGHKPVPWYDWALGVLSFLLAFYHWVFEADLIQRSGNPSTADIVVGVAVIALLFEAARRAMGKGLPILCLLFIPLALYGRHLPGPFMNRGFDFEQVIDQLYVGTDGIYGLPTLVSATYIFLFILFGSFLEKAGMIGLFYDVAMGTVGHTQGGPAKVAVISSGLMGTINGSGIANVLTVGQFTIPLMRRFGYRPAFAGAVEATASMGGQIMPPVMGAVAFIMAESLNVPYGTIAIAATIPALLYYLSAFWVVHLEAGRHHLVGLPRDQCPSALRALRRDWHLVLPLAALVYMLFAGFTPLFAGTVGLALTALMIIGASVTNLVESALLRITFWIALGLVIGGLIVSDLASIPTALFAAIAILSLLCLRIGRRATVDLLITSLSDGAKSALGVGLACALVGVIVGTVTLTGLATDLSRIVLGLAGHSLFLALVMTMVMAIILGTGIPTIPTYIICSAMAAPALSQLGVLPIVSHMFVFYFGIMADLTPPVALAALAASSITKTSYVEIGFLATRVALAGYVIPFVGVYAPSLMFQGDWTVISVVYVTVKTTFSIGLWGAATTGFLFGRVGLFGRAWATAAAILVVVSIPWMDETGFALGALFIAHNYWRMRVARAVVA